MNAGRKICLRNEENTMKNQYTDKALSKLKEELPGIKGQKELVMKKAVAEALESFCRQDASFAQAVAEGGSFSDCMKAVAKGTGNSISDLEAYRKAVRFYFPQAEVRFAMTVETGTKPAETGTKAAKPASIQPKPAPIRKILDLTDFL